jgi:GATA zinc finger
MTQLEWLSNFFDDGPSDTFPFGDTIVTGIAAKAPCTTSPDPKNVECTITIPTPISLAAPNDITKDDPNHLFCTSSPVSVLEQTSYSGGSTASSSVSSSSSFSSSNSFSRASLSPRSVTPPEPNFVIPARPRSKRSRPASFSQRNHVIVPFVPPSSETQHIIESLAESDPVAVSVPVPMSMLMPVLPAVQVPAPVLPPAKKKKKSAKRASCGDNEEAEWGEFQPQATTARRCMHCQIEKTPQWRAGPMGPKTLCNACGVRYKSGRLFPEYRPAASPTFVPSIHSNSHKKVVEMRLKSTQTTDACRYDLLQLIRRKRE